MEHHISCCCKAAELALICLCRVKVVTLPTATKGVSTEGSGLSKVKTYTTQQMILQVELDTGLALLLNSLEDLL